MSEEKRLTDEIESTTESLLEEMFVAQFPGGEAGPAGREWVIMSEPSLAKDWLSLDDEDEAWAHL